MAGLKRAIVSTLWLPAFIVVFLVSFAIFVIFADNGVAGVWRTLLAALLLVTSGLGVVMVGRVYQWANNSPTVVSPERYVWRFVGAACLALICAGVSLRNSSGSLRASKASENEETGVEVKAQVRVAAGRQITFRMLRIDVLGNETPLDVHGTIFAPEDRDFESMISIIVKDPKPNDQDQLREIEVSYTTPFGGPYSKTLSLGGDWTVKTSGKGSSQLLEGEKDRFEIATRKDWLGRKAETLYIESAGAPRSSGASEKKGETEKQP